MEVLVTRTEGLPEECVLSIRAGSTRRQAPIKDITGRALKFPAAEGPQKCSPFKIDILSTVAVARLLLRPGEENYNVQLESRNGESQTPMCVDFTLREDQSLKQANRAKTEAVDDRDVLPKGSIEPDSLKYRDAANSARQYLESHDILNFVQCLLQTVIRERPDDPYLFMAKQMYTPESVAPSRCVTPFQGDLDYTRATVPAPKPPVVREEAEESKGSTEAPSDQAKPIETPKKEEEAKPAEIPKEEEKLGEKPTEAPKEEAKQVEAKEGVQKPCPKKLHQKKLVARKSFEDAMDSGKLHELCPKKGQEKTPNPDLDDIKCKLIQGFDEAIAGGTLLNLADPPVKTQEAEVEKPAGAEKCTPAAVQEGEMLTLSLVQEKVKQSLVKASESGLFEEYLTDVLQNLRLPNTPDDGLESLKQKLVGALDTAIGDGNLDDLMAPDKAVVEAKVEDKKAEGRRSRPSLIDRNSLELTSPDDDFGGYAPMNYFNEEEKQEAKPMEPPKEEVEPAVEMKSNEELKALAVERLESGLETGLLKQFLNDSKESKPADAPQPAEAPKEETKEDEAQAKLRVLAANCLEAALDSGALDQLFKAEAKTQDVKPTEAPKEEATEAAKEDSLEAMREKAQKIFELGLRSGILNTMLSETRYSDGEIVKPAESKQVQPPPATDVRKSVPLDPEEVKFIADRARGALEKALQDQSLIGVLNNVAPRTRPGSDDAPRSAEPLPQAVDLVPTLNEMLSKTRETLETALASGYLHDLLGLETIGASENADLKEPEPERTSVKRLSVDDDFGGYAPKEYVSEELQKEASNDETLVKAPDAPKPEKDSPSAKRSLSQTTSVTKSTLINGLRSGALHKAVDKMEQDLAAEEAARDAESKPAEPVAAEVPEKLLNSAEESEDDVKEKVKDVLLHAEQSGLLAEVANAINEHAPEETSVASCSSTLVPNTNKTRPDSPETFTADYVKGKLAENRRAIEEQQALVQKNEELQKQINDNSKKMEEDKNAQILALKEHTSRLEAENKLLVEALATTLKLENRQIKATNEKLEAENNRLRHDLSRLTPEPSSHSSLPSNLLAEHPQS